jgi:hypothetical protein
MLRGKVNHYWDIDDFLAEEEQLIFVTNQDIRGLGYLDRSNRSSEDLPANTKITAPYWTIIQLAKSSAGLCDLPPFLKQNYRHSLKADATLLTLGEKSKYYFEIGAKLANMLKDTELVPVLLRAFFERMRHVLEKLETAEEPRVYKKLTNLEVNLFEIARRSTRDLRDWLERRHEKISKAALISRPTKRRKVNS